MARQANKIHLTEFDMMIIRAGGRTQSELEASVLNGASFRRQISAIFADSLYRIARRFEASANRSVEETQRRFVARAAR